MKEKILTLDEIKKLDDGTKVWVDCPANTLFKRINRLCEKRNSPFMRLDIIGTNMCLGLESVTNVEYVVYKYVE